MSNTYDALVIGGGHNGLVSAAYWPVGSQNTGSGGALTLGGAATTEAPWEDAPHLRVTRLSYVMSLMPPTIVRSWNSSAMAKGTTATTRPSPRAAR